MRIPSGQGEPSGLRASEVGEGRLHPGAQSNRIVFFRVKDRAYLCHRLGAMDMLLARGLPGDALKEVEGAQAVGFAVGVFGQPVEGFARGR